MIKILWICIFTFYGLSVHAQQYDSTHTTYCHRTSSSDGTDSQSKSIEYFNSGKLYFKESFSYGLGYGQFGFGNVNAYTASLHFYDTLSNSDSLIIYYYDSGNLNYSITTTTYFDSIGRTLQIISYYNNSLSGIKTYQYDLNGNMILSSNLGYNGTAYQNIRTEISTFSLTNKLLSLIRIENPTMDSTLIKKNYYNAFDSLQTEEQYFKNQSSNTTYLAFKVDRTFHSSGKITEERSYSGDSLMLYYSNKTIFYYDALTPSGKLISKENYLTDNIPYELLSRNDFYYITSDDYTMYVLFCDTNSCSDTNSYTHYTIQNLPYQYTSETYSAYYNNGYYTYHRTGASNEFRDLGGRLIYKSEYSSNYPPPLYSEFTSDTFAYDTNGVINLHCYHRGGSHINDVDACCFDVYSNQNAPLSLELIGDTSKYYCPGEYAAIERIIYGGKPPYTLAWNITPVDSILSLTYSISDKSENYILTVTDSLGNMTTDSILIHRLYVQDSATDTVFCPGDLITFDAGPGQLANDYEYFFYVLNDSVVEISSNQFAIDQSGVYNFGMILGMCADTLFSMDRNFIVNRPLIDFGQDTVVCLNQPVTISAAPGLTYAWSNGDSVSSVTFNSAITDSFMVSCIVTDTAGCTNSDTIQINYTVCAGILNESNENIKVQYMEDENIFVVSNQSNQRIEIVFMNILNQHIGAFEIESGTNEYILFEKPLGIYTYMCNSHSEIVLRGKILVR